MMVTTSTKDRLAAALRTGDAMSRRLENMMPSISVVTPSFNQANYLTETLYSIHAHDPGCVEHIVIDGGSTDGTRDILRCFDDQISFWSSEPDAGQYDAINKGFSRSRGDLMAWLNSDDVYYPWTIKTVIEIFDTHPEIQWLTTRHPSAVNSAGAMIRMPETHGFDRASFRKGFNLTGAGWAADTFIQQESTFWRRSLWEKAGGRVDDTLHYAGDFELWLRFFDCAELYSIDVPLAGFRRHSEQKTSRAFETYVAEARTCLERAGCAIPPPAVMAWQLAQRRMQDGGRALIEAGLADRVPRLNYDWAGGDWIVEYV